MISYEVTYNRTYKHTCNLITKTIDKRDINALRVLGVECVEVLK